MKQTLLAPIAQEIGKRISTSQLEAFEAAQQQSKKQKRAHKHHPEPSEESVAECVQVLKAFKRGGLPGCVRLKQVLYNVFASFGISSFETQIALLQQAGFATTFIAKSTNSLGIHEKWHATFAMKQFMRMDDDDELH